MGSCNYLFKARSSQLAAPESVLMSESCQFSTPFCWFLVHIAAILLSRIVSLCHSRVLNNKLE